MIECHNQDDVRNWDKDLHLITMALHATVNRSTGFTPNQLMLGREVILPADRVIGGVRHKMQLPHHRNGFQSSLTKWQYCTVKLEDI